MDGTAKHEITRRNRGRFISSPGPPFGTEKRSLQKASVHCSPSISRISRDAWILVLCFSTLSRPSRLSWKWTFPKSHLCQRLCFPTPMLFQMVWPRLVAAIGAESWVPAWAGLRATERYTKCRMKRRASASQLLEPCWKSPVPSLHKL